MIFDCFPFYNELDLLELRLHELHDVVDYFVLAEATLTHSGLPKPLYYQENWDRFKEFHKQVVHIVVDDMPVTKEEIREAIPPEDQNWLVGGYQLGDDWVRERYQRNAVMRAFSYCLPDDIVIIEDADEMVRPEIVARLPEIIQDGSNAVEQVLHTYYLNWKCTNMPWWGSKVLRLSCFTNPSEHRFHTPAVQYIRDGGWHFGYLGGVNAIKDKIRAFAHQEFNNYAVFSKIESKLANLEDGISRQYQYEVVPIDESYPKYIRDNIEKYDEMGWIYK